MRPPPPYAELRAPGALVWALPAARAWAQGIVDGGRTLYGAAGRVDGRAVLQGRGPAWVVPAPGGGRWVVRHYRRGGRVAPLLGDRYLKLGTPRPLRELLASAEVARRGVPTPTVVAGAVYPSGPFYRGDVVTEHVPDSADLAEVVFGPAPAEPPAAIPMGPPPATPRARQLALGRAGRLVATLGRTGIRHGDLNAKNLLFAGRDDPGAATVLLIDLDRCVLVDGPLDDGGAGMYARLGRSLRKLGLIRGAPLERLDWEALLAGFEGRA